LRRRLAPNAQQPGVKAVMVAATTHGEGATTTSAILASMLARSGHAKILLVDANLRTPALDGVFNDNNSPEGLTDVIISDKPVEAAIYQTNFSNLFLLPVGRPHSSPSYLFDGDPISNLLTTLKERFDFIIFDSAPSMVTPSLFSWRPKSMGNSGGRVGTHEEAGRQENQKRAGVGRADQSARDRVEQKEKLHSGLVGAVYLSPL